MLKRYLPLAGIALFAFAACSPDSTDFKDEGEDYIESDDFREQIGEGVFTSDGNFTDASCEEPENTDVGTRYECTATSPDGEELIIPIEITGERELSVDGAGIRSADATDDTTAPDDTTAADETTAPDDTATDDTAADDTTATDETTTEDTVALTENEFSTEAQAYISDPAGDIVAESGYTFTDAFCDVPASTDVGTQFECTATDNEGDDWILTLEITGPQDFIIADGNVVEG